MALKRPPQHRVDAKIVYVHPRDEAWNDEKVAEEVLEHFPDGSEYLEHPFYKYTSGAGRYDLDAEYTVGAEIRRPRDYFRDGVKPTKWYLRRLDWQDWYEIQSELSAHGRANKEPYPVYMRALQVGLERVEDGPKLEGPPDRLTRSDLDKLYAMRFHDGDQIVDPAIDIGRAVIVASVPLRDDEGKH